MHFRKEAKPREAREAKRCLACAYEPNCPYSAKKFYLHEMLRQGKRDWPLDVITTDLTEEGVIASLQYGPYGRCVYECDNDVNDHQVVNLLYDNGATASFTMIGPSESRQRQTSIYGTRGELRGDGEKLIHYDYLSNKIEETFTKLPDSRMNWHGGGDYRLMQRFVAAVAKRDPSGIVSGPTESLETHLTVFAAERARRENRVVQL